MIPEGATHYMDDIDYDIVYLRWTIIQWHIWNGGEWIVYSDNETDIIKPPITGLFLEQSF